MTPLEFDRIAQFFDGYTRQFVSSAADPAPHRLKIEHTRRVCANIEYLCKALNKDENTLFTAKTSALLHDIGRFIQYDTFGTFSDRISANHAVLGVRVIHEHRLLNPLTRTEKSRIIKAVALHNVLSLHPRLDPDTLWLTRLLRDADKMDILKVMTDLYLHNPQDSEGYITWDLKDNGQMSDELIQRVFNKEMIDNTTLTSLNDLKLLQISWIFDLNFEPALKRVAELGYIPGIISTLPRSAKIERLLEFTTHFLEQGIPCKGRTLEKTMAE
ncbi:MAG: HD domain-containing protein [Desulfobacteraceae bacterium]|nr:MAG: HD domain-containing protein [Desulfobacteraceae bacterium]